MPCELVALRVASHVPCRWSEEMLSCLAPTWEFSPFPCKAGLEQAVLWGSGPHSRDGKPGSDWLCHPSSLVMAGDTRVTRSHTLYLSMNGLK